jgi:hypothetical protein
VQYLVLLARMRVVPEFLQILVGIVNLGLPFLLGYRISIAKEKKRAEHDNK